MNACGRHVYARRERVPTFWRSKRNATVDQLVRYDGELPPIGSGVPRIPRDELRGHVRLRPRDDDAGADAGAEGEDADATVGVEEDDLIENTQASKVEIHAALADGPAFRDPNRGDRWRGIDDTYAAHVLEMLVVTAQAKGMACLLYTSPSPRD